MKRIILLLALIGLTFADSNDFSSFILKRDIDSRISAYIFVYKNVEYIVVYSTEGCAITPAITNQTPPSEKSLKAEVNKTFRLSE